MTPPALDALHWRFYIIFAVINAAFLPPIYFFYPETKGLSLEEVDTLFVMGHGRSGAADSYETKTEPVEHLDMTTNREADFVDSKV